jgi:hypothetical protein
MITLAFYKGRGDGLWFRFQDWAIRFATRSIYSHVEMISGRAELGETSQCWSSSGRDGGVRMANITLKPGHWDLVELADEPDELTDFIQERAFPKKKYDYIGIVLSQILSLGRHNPDKWFCSEICAAALGIPNAQRMSPQSLYDMVTWKHLALPPEPQPLPSDPPGPPALG